MATYPANDDQFTEYEINEVKITNELISLKFAAKNYLIDRKSQWNPDTPFFPQAGHVARFYGTGLDAKPPRIRGLFINGVKIFYLTAEEDKRFREEKEFGRDIQEWLFRWEIDRPVWSIAMEKGGLAGRQSVHLAAVEFIRWLCNNGMPGDLEPMLKEVSENSTVSGLNLSDHQKSLAKELAVDLFKRGPTAVFTDPALKDRAFIIRRSFPIL